MVMPNVSLGQHFDEFIETQIEQGRFQNASEVVRAGLRLLQEHELEVRERKLKFSELINQAFDEEGEDIPLELMFKEIESIQKINKADAHYDL
jgi:antitoxin ParD1/3/4